MPPHGACRHVTVLYPFLAQAAVDEAALAALSAAVGTVAAFHCTFARTAWFGSEVLWVAPDPSEPLRQLEPLSAAEMVVQSRLPFRQRVDHVLLITGSEQPQSWRTVKRLLLRRRGERDARAPARSRQLDTL
jgi:2'-5' RNA ligase superfamily